MPRKERRFQSNTNRFCVSLKGSFIGGAEGRNRTDTGLPLLDFESSASTNFTTPAYKLEQKEINGALSEI